MTSKWRTVPVGKLGRIVTGKTPKTAIADNYGGAIPFLTPSEDMNVKEVDSTAKTLSEKGLLEVKNCLLPPRSVCVSCIGSNLGKVVLTTLPTVTNQQINSIIPGIDMDPDFIYYAMTILGKKLNYMSKTSTAVPIVNKSSFSSYVVRIPTLEIQQSISSVLSALDAQITNNTKIDHQLELMAQAIFKSWFVDFKPYLNADFVNSELGEIPKGWQIGTLSDLVTVRYGKDHKKLENGSIPVFGSGGVIRFANTALYSNESVLIPRKGTLNHVIYVNQPFWSVDTMFYTEMNRPNIAKFVYFYMKSKNLKSMNAGSAVPSMTTEILNSLQIVIPPETELARFEEVTSTQFDQIQKKIKENDTLAALRDILLPRLMSGELPVSDVDIEHIS